MSAEYFDTLGLIICGLNPITNLSEVYWYDTNKNKWTFIKELFGTEKGFTFTAVKVV